MTQPRPTTRPVEPGHVEIVPVPHLPEVTAGDDLVALLAPALRTAGLRDGDVVCVSTKIVSKSLGLTVEPADRDAAIERAAVRTVARRLHTLRVTSIVEIPSGPVMAAAGVDGSNAPGGPLLLPEDPDACARALREGLVAALGVELGVLLTDTSSRVWRVGVGDVALGAAGVASLQDLRGEADDTGRTLHVTVRDLADELAAAADLVKGKASRVPVAIVRGVAGAVVADPRDEVPAARLARTGGDDWFRRPSLESVWQSLGLALEDEPVARMSPEPDDERIDRALAVAALPRRGAALLAARAERTAPDRIDVRPTSPGTAALLDAAALGERVRTALAAEEIAVPLPLLHVRIHEETA